MGELGISFSFWEGNWDVLLLCLWVFVNGGVGVLLCLWGSG